MNKILKTLFAGSLIVGGLTFGAVSTNDSIEPLGTEARPIEVDDFKTNVDVDYYTYETGKFEKKTTSAYVAGSGNLFRKDHYWHGGWDELFFVFNGTYYVPENETYEVTERVDIDDEVIIILGTNASIHFCGGIQLSEGCNLRVYSESLKAPGKFIVDTNNNFGPAIGGDFWDPHVDSVYEQDLRPFRQMGNIFLDCVNAEISSIYRCAIGSYRTYGGSFNAYASHVTLEGVDNGIENVSEINFNNGSIELLDCGVDAESMKMNEGKFSAKYIRGTAATNLIAGEDVMLKYSSNADLSDANKVELNATTQTEILNNYYFELMRDDERGLHFDALNTGSCFLCHHTYEYKIKVFYKHGQTEPKVFTLYTTQDAKSYLHRYDFTIFTDIPATDLVDLYLEDGTPFPYDYFTFKPGQEVTVYAFWSYNPKYHCCEAPWIFNHFYNALTDLYYYDREQQRPIGDAVAFHYWSQLDGDGYRPASPHVDNDKNGWCDVCGCTGSVQIIFHTLMDTMFNMTPDVVCKSSNTFMYAYNKFIKGKFTYPGTLQYFIYQGEAINSYCPIPLSIDEKEDLYGFFKFDKEVYKRKSGHKEYYFNSYTELFYEDYDQKNVIGNWDDLQVWLLGKGKINPNPADMKSFLFYKENTNSYVEMGIPTNAVYFDNEYNSCLLEGGWYVFTDTFSLNGEVHVYGDTRIILADGCNVTFNQGLNVYPDARLTIYTQTLDKTKAGKIISYPTKHCPGIGAIEVETDDDGNILRGSDVYIYGGNFDIRPREYDAKGYAFDNSSNGIGYNAKKLTVMNAKITGNLFTSVISVPKNASGNFYNCDVDIKSGRTATKGLINFYDCKINVDTEYGFEGEPIFGVNVRGGSLSLQTSFYTDTIGYSIDGAFYNNPYWEYYDSVHSPRKGWNVTMKEYVPGTTSHCTVHGRKPVYGNVNGDKLFYEDAEFTKLIGNYSQTIEWLTNGDGCLPLVGTCADNDHDMYCDTCGMRDDSYLNGYNLFIHYSHRYVLRSNTESMFRLRDDIDWINGDESSFMHLDMDGEIVKVFNADGTEADLDSYYKFNDTNTYHYYCLVHYPANEEHEEFYCNTLEGKYYKADGVTPFDYHPTEHCFNQNTFDTANVHKDGSSYTLDVPCAYFGCDEHQIVDIIYYHTRTDVEPTCTENAVYKDSLGYKYQRGTIGFANIYEVENSALGHNYSGTHISWDDNECVATAFCRACGEEITRTAIGEYVKDSDPTCTENEKGHYECHFEESFFGTQRSPQIEIENTALGHDFTKNVEYTWDGILCTVHAECAREGCHETITETAQAEYFEEKHSTCKSLSTGHYEITFKSDFIGSTATEEGSVQIEHSDQQHVFGGQVTYEVEGNVCTASWGCVTEGCFERESETVIGEYVKDSDATCTENEKGHYEFTFEKPEFGTYRTESKSVDGPAQAYGHLFGENPSYTITGNQCTASLHCEHNGCDGTISETVTGEYVKDTNATCEENEKGHYEFTFANEKFGTYSSPANSFEVPETAIGHSYKGEITYLVNGDKCTASLHCEHSGCTDALSETVTAVYVKDTDATNKHNEKGHYEFVFTDETYGTYRTDDNSIEVPDTKLKGGCSGSLDSTSLIFTAVALMGAILCTIKKKKYLA